MCAHRLSLFYLFALKKKATLFVCLLSSIPESPHWLLLKKRMDILERYRNNSPKDKHFLDLVMMQLLDSSFSTCCFWVTDSSYLDESHVILIICCPARNSSKFSKKRDLLSKCWWHITFCGLLVKSTCQKCLCVSKCRFWIQPGPTCRRPVKSRRRGFRGASPPVICFTSNTQRFCCDCSSWPT